jgi:hypothetical protein
VRNLRRRKVWAVMPSYDYEGYGDPAAVFTSRKAAERYLASNDRPPIGGDEAMIVETVLFQPKGKTRKATP